MRMGLLQKQRYREACGARYAMYLIEYHLRCTLPEVYRDIADLSFCVCPDFTTPDTSFEALSVTTSIALCKRFIVSFKHLGCTLQGVYREHYHLRCTLPEVYREISAAVPFSLRSAAVLVLLTL